MWDIRYHTKNPVQIFEIPQKFDRKKSGKLKFLKNILKELDII